MRKPKRAALAAAPLSLALLLAACSGDDDSADDTTTTTTTEATTASPETTAPPPTSETTAPPADETTAPPETSSEAGSPLPESGAAAASELVRAWGAGDRARAAELATPEVVDQLFGHAEVGGDDWERLWCDSTAVELYCTFTSASRRESLTTQEGSGGIATVTFGTATADVSPELAEGADALIRAWGSGDRDAAGRFASETDVQTLFGYVDPGGATWERVSCLDVDGDEQCAYRSPDHDETVILHLGGGPLPVSHVLVFFPS